MKKIMKIVLELCFLGVYVSNTFAQTLLPSSINSDTTLSDTLNYYYSISTITVQSGVVLTIEKGVEIHFPASSGITVLGSLIVNGTEENPVLFTSVNDTIRWSFIVSNQGLLNLSYLRVTNARRFLSASYGSVYLNHCYVENTYGGIGDDCIGAHYVSEIVMEYCEFHGNPSMARIDGVDCDDITDGIFRYNSIYDFEDDGIDIGTSSSNVLIEHNYINNCNFGVSIGENSTAVVRRNIIVGCDGAMQSHTGAYINASNNTFYKNQEGLECHHGGSANTAGSMDVKNTIFAQTLGVLYVVQAATVLNISYSLSDTDTLPGASNLFGDPKFADPENGDFSLLSNSPCINHGDPADTTDTCSYPIDIGAIEFGCSDTTHTTIIEVGSNSFNELNLFPNPSRGEFRISSFNNTSLSFPCVLNLYSLDGKMVKTTIIKNSETSILVFELKSGMYVAELYELNDTCRTFKGKLMLQK